MKFTVVGTGAMGLQFGVLLQEAGNDVNFIESWQPHYDKGMRRRLRYPGA